MEKDGRAFAIMDLIGARQMQFAGSLDGAVLTPT